MKEFSQKIFVDYSMVDKEYTLKLSSLLRFMQNAATEHYDKKGLGRARLISEGMVFLLSKISLKLTRHIKAEEIFTLTTWEGEIKGAYFVRNFAFLINGEKVGEAQTLWVIVNPETHAILRPTDFPYPVESLGREVDVSAGKISERGLAETVCETRRVRYSELDCNGHMNNCVYADWCVDLINKNSTEFEINFNHEAKLDDTLTLTLFATPKESNLQNTPTVVSGSFPDGKNCFKARIL